jgi:hypothetical protein
MKRKAITTLSVMFFVLVLCGCTYIKPSDTLIIDDTLGNAVAMNKLAQADPAIPPAYKQWIQGDVAQWQWFSDKAHRRTTPTTMPVK